LGAGNVRFASNYWQATNARIEAGGRSFVAG